MEKKPKDIAMPAPASIAGRPLSPTAPDSAGQLKRSPQGGVTDNATDGGGGMGNSMTELHNAIIGKK